jgi:zinc/manganese transport system ATP-binding protein
MSGSSDDSRDKPSLGQRLAGARKAMAPAASAIAASTRWAARQVGRGARVCFDNGYDATPHDALGARGAIALSNTTIAYGRRVAVETLTGSFPAGSLTAVAGPNGGGKSTLLKGLAGLKRPRRGEIWIDAMDRRRVAYLPQQADIDAQFPVTVREFVTVGGWRSFGAFREAPEALRQNTKAAIAAVGLEGLAARPIADLTPGQLRRALFARLIVQDAAVMLLDEPFAAVDDETVAALLPLLAQWQAQGRTIVAVLHDLDQARTHFPTALLLARTAVAWGPTETVLTSSNMAQANAALGRPEPQQRAAA